MKKQIIEFERAQAPIADAVTKFGGAPSWFSSPQWPLSRGSGDPMHFIAQIAIDPTLFGGQPGRVAYLFMTEMDGDTQPSPVPSTWEPEGGENALIIQPSQAELLVEAAPLREGPSLFEVVYPKPRQRGIGIQSPCEFAVQLSEPVEDPARDVEDFDFENKIGGVPVWFQSDEVPGEGWRLLLQLDSAGVPFEINFGDAGVGYAFLSPDGQSGRFLWQCG